ncbi:STAS domain-containing protein [Chromobacterium piscinae]|uniref:STAS domain-containing protein n=1 Tax=Chromobacterium piscinae TaxID=686831 RepID=A0ABV0GYZ4_9NEIS|nr:STAS domain-containing protein [Chromobacterium piscinae]MBX9298154.1 STAS domain-containing protein [Chromobacterium vaccinii]MBX9348196.1 STAS domain-containing protein [Chromobacterium vaccinii]MBX9355579.1 STAS domain-containing protein [Chromobacterium vaccinii]MCD4506369.1 STAS domain-containing protein [Chromobacterium piscinae]NHQ83728.1 STAS domain-containing protein [Chromobacterium vaccinii]
MALSIVAGHEQTIYQASQWRAELDAALQSGEDILLDLSSIEEIDCSGLQVLLWLQREATRQNRRIGLLDPSRPLGEFLRLMGMEGELAFKRSGAGDGS